MKKLVKAACLAALLSPLLALANLSTPADNADQQADDNSEVMVQHQTSSTNDDQNIIASNDHSANSADQKADSDSDDAGVTTAQ